MQSKIEANNIMRTFIMAICCLFLSFGLSAQNEITVLSGQVLYYAQTGANPVLKNPGTQFELKGKLRCKGTGSAKLVYKGYYFWVKGTKMRNVQDVVNGAVKNSEMSFSGRFFNFLTESVKEGENPETVKKHHRKYMNKSSGGIKGYTNREYAIPVLLLTSGKLPAANVIFKWRNTAGSGPYTFQLFGSGGKQVAQVLVRDTFLTLDLDQLSMDIFAEYEWKVTRGEGVRSASIPIEICPDKSKELYAEISQEEDFKSADPTEQQLMLAYSLEEERCFYAANKTYEHLLSMDPSNLLLRKMYATFLARMDMLPEANAILLR